MSGCALGFEFLAAVLATAARLRLATGRSSDAHCGPDQNLPVTRGVHGVLLEEDLNLEAGLPPRPASQAPAAIGRWNPLEDRPCLLEFR